MNTSAISSTSRGVSSENAVSVQIERIQAMDSEHRSYRTWQRVAFRYFFHKAPLVAFLLVVMNRADMIASAAILCGVVATAIHAAAAIRLAGLSREYDAVVSGLDSLN